MLKKCDVCSKEYETRSRSPDRERFCSKRCNSRYWNRQMWAKRRPQQPPPGTCEICGIEFARKRSHPKARTCSQACNSKRMDKVRSAKKAEERDISDRPCEECGTVFTPSIYNWKTNKFCSSKCAGRVAARSFTKRHPGHSTKSAQKNRWGGKWAIAYERDGGVCVLCGESEKRREMHHIDGSGEEDSPNHEIDNLILLCVHCHRQMHTLTWKIVDNELLVSGFVCEWLGLERVRIVKEAEHAEQIQ